MSTHFNFELRDIVEKEIYKIKESCTKAIDYNNKVVRSSYLNAMSWFCRAFELGIPSCTSGDFFNSENFRPWLLFTAIRDITHIGARYCRPSKEEIKAVNVYSDDQGKDLLFYATSMVKYAAVGLELLSRNDRMTGQFKAAVTTASLVAKALGFSLYTAESLFSIFNDFLYLQLPTVDVELPKTDEVLRGIWSKVYHFDGDTEALEKETQRMNEAIDVQEKRCVEVLTPLRNSLVALKTKHEHLKEFVDQMLSSLDHNGKQEAAEIPSQGKQEDERSSRK